MALGLGVGTSGSSTRLSRERKHRMRELATQKLCRAYQLDEIAASVATMQGASSLEEVASLVLQRNTADTDAKYVHFFHEKIPSRMLAQCTSLRALDEVIQDRPSEGAPLRTRAITRIFKDDYLGAANDLSKAIAVCRHSTAQHRAGRGQLELANALGGSQRRNGGSRDWRYEKKIDEVDQPSSLETQLLFHRAGVYLTLACQNVQASLESPNPQRESVIRDPRSHQGFSAKLEGSQLEAHKLVKANAKRALRDYVTFLSYFDYTPGLPSEMTEEFFRKVNSAAGGLAKSQEGLHATKVLEMSGNSRLSNGNLSDALSARESAETHKHSESVLPYSGEYLTLPLRRSYAVSSLFSSSPPPDLPAYPAVCQALITRKAAMQQRDPDGTIKQNYPDSGQHEAVTYHPLFTDALHSLLLCHSLIQTSPKEILRHAHMVSRLARICDGYPIFLAARSPSRADWMEVLQRANNWIGLQHSWESLCAPAPLPGLMSATKRETEEQTRERCRQEAIIETLADERVHDEVSFQAAVAARERRSESLPHKGTFQNGISPKRWAQEDGKDYPVSTERAETIASWVKKAPTPQAGTGRTKCGLGKGKALKANGVTANKCGSATSVVDGKAAAKHHKA